MRFRWPEDTVFRRLVLDVEDDACGQCGRRLHICDHRFHRVYTLQGPLELCCRLAHCSDRACPARSRTHSPAAELALTLPGWLLGWDVFCWLGFRRFARHWSVPQLRDELRDSYQIRLSDDAVAVYLRRYQSMVAARHQDATRLAAAYRDIDRLVLTIDGLQPEKGHETLYVVRELRGKRVWFAEALLSSATAEVQRLLRQAKQWAGQLSKPVELWLSDKQDAFVQGIAAEFAGVPHRYCQNHFLRDVAKPVLEQDSHAKVQMRRRVRGLRDIERQVLQQRRAEPPAEPGAAAEPPAQPAGAGGAAPVADEAGQVVLDYCAAVRGILNDDQGGPLHPPGVRMAEGLQEVRASLQRSLDAQKGGVRTSNCAASPAASTAGCKPSPTSRRSSAGRSRS